MSMIDEMIRELCPDGIEQGCLGDCCSAVFAGGTPSTSRVDYYDGNIPWIRSGEIDFNRIYKADRNITEKGLSSSSAKMIKPCSVVMAMTGATVGKVATVEINTAANQSVCALETDNNKINYRYLFYYLSSHYHDLKSSAQGALTSLNLQIIKALQIPLPPLPIQQEIVSILDKFTDHIADLDSAITLRQKQFEYCREKLLTFNEGECEWKKLGEIGKMIRGNGLQKKDFTDEGYPCIHYGQVHTVYDYMTTSTKSFCSESLANKLRKAQYGDLIIATTSEDVEACCKAVVWLGNVDVAYSGDSYCFKHNQNPKYVSYLFQTEKFAKQKRQAATGTKVVRVSGESMENFLLPFPSFEHQAEIVSILDRFKELVNNLIETKTLRQKQFEYYRNKLLSF